MFQDFIEAATFVRENDIRMIDSKFCDLGRCSCDHFQRVTPELMEAGITLTAPVSASRAKAGDTALIPTRRPDFDPFWEMPTLSFICDTAEADTKERFAGDPRIVVQRAEAYMQEHGFATESLWGPEFEFYVFKCGVGKHCQCS